MRYLGGKSRIRRPVSSFLTGVRGGRPYLEPFVGGAWILAEMRGVRTASDANEALITLYRAVQRGWVAPDGITEETYKNHVRDPKDPLTAFLGFGCSWGSKWFGGWARGGDHVGAVRRSLTQLRPRIRDVRFTVGSYLEHRPVGHLVYCDPPYAGTTGYDGVAPFDHEEFWDVMRVWSRKNVVVVSEYAAPPDFEVVREMSSRMGLGTGAGGAEKAVRREYLFMVRGTHVRPRTLFDVGA